MKLKAALMENVSGTLSHMIPQDGKAPSFSAEKELDLQTINHVGQFGEYSFGYAVFT